MEQLTVALPERAYDIIMERGLLQQVGQQCREVLKPGCRVAVVTDSNVAIQYGSLVQESLTQAGFVAKIFLVPAGERSKSPEVLTWLWEELLGFGLTRSDAVAALGGGMVGDLAGFAAATVLRGVDFHHPPGTGGLFGRRQGGHRPEGRQEPGRCLLAAQTGAHGPGRAGQPVR